MENIEQKPYGIIYFALNKLNGKCYVGQSIQAEGKRWKQHISSSRHRGSKLYFHKAIHHYGPENFEFRTILSCPDQASLNSAETYFIEFFGSIDPKIGYNSTLGGDAEVPSEQTKKNMITAWAKRRGGDIPDTETLIRDYKSGLSSVKIAKKYGISKFCVLRRFKVVGFDTRSNSESKRLPGIPSLGDEYLAGKDLGVLAEKYGVTPSWVWGQLKQSNVPLRTATASRTLNMEKTGELSTLPSPEDLAEEYLSGVSSVKLSKKYNTTKTRILAYLIKSGITLRTKSEAWVGRKQSKT